MKKRSKLDLTADVVQKDKPQASGFGAKAQTDSRPESETSYTGTKAASDTRQPRHAQAATTQGSSRALIVLSVAAVAIAAVTLVMLKRR